MKTRIYTNDSISHMLKLNSEQKHYLKSVLRLSSMRKVNVFNEDQGEFHGELRGDRIIVGRKIREKEMFTHLCLGICIIKSKSFLRAIDMATQLRATEIQPIISDRAQAKHVNMERCKRRIIEAAQQSNRVSIPKIHDPIRLAQYLCTNEIIICANESSKGNLCHVPDKIFLLIGPEGGFSPEEQNQLNSSERIINITLGPTILRSETAVASAISILNSMKKIYENAS